MTHSQSAMAFSQMGASGPPTPALLQSRWTAPKASRVFWASASTSLAWETSVRTASTVAPEAFMLASVFVNASSSTSARTAFIPSCTQRSAMARPMPLAAPVMTATLSLKSFMAPLRLVDSSGSSSVGRTSRGAPGSLLRLAGLLREVLLGGDRFGVAELQGSHEGGMHLRGGDDGALELLVARGAGIMHDDAPVAKVARGAGAGVHAHVAHRAADDDLLDAVAVENGLEVRLAEGVDLVLEHDGLAFQVLDLRVDLGP